MLFQRKQIEFLYQWKNKKRRKPLIVRRVKQVGEVAI